MSSYLLGLTIAQAEGNLVSDWWWSNTITSIFKFCAYSIGSNDSVPQSTVKIIFALLLIKFLKPLLLGPYPSVCLSGT